MQGQVKMKETLASTIYSGKRALLIRLAGPERCHVLSAASPDTAARGHRINLRVMPLERSVIFIRCLSHCLLFSLLLLLLFFLWESSLEVLDNAFFFLLFRSVTLSLLMKVTLSLCWLRHRITNAHLWLSALHPTGHSQKQSYWSRERCGNENALYVWLGWQLHEFTHQILIMNYTVNICAFHRGGR